MTQGTSRLHSPGDLTRQQLEQTWQHRDRTPWLQTLQQWGERLSAGLVRGLEPQITQTATPAGSIWKVYDPSDEQTRWFDSEQEVRIWLEQRYHQG